MKCLNCHTQFDGNFCFNCGQKKLTSGFTFKDLSSSLITNITNLDKGIFYNLKNLTTKPYNFVNGYIDGKRKYVFNPISYAIIAVTLYLLLRSLLKLESSEIIIDESLKKTNGYNFGVKIGEFLQHNIKPLFLLNVVFYGWIMSWFHKRRNLLEHIAINAFILGHAVFIGLIFYPILKSPLIFNPIMFIVIIILHLRIYKGYDKTYVIFISSIITILLSLLLQFGLSTLGHLIGNSF